MASKKSKACDNPQWVKVFPELKWVASTRQLLTDCTMNKKSKRSIWINSKQGQKISKKSKIKKKSNLHINRKLIRSVKSWLKIETSTKNHLKITWFSKENYFNKNDKTISSFKQESNFKNVLLNLESVNILRN